MKILVVEDEPAIAEVVVAYARREGYETLWAADGNRVLHHGPGRGHGAHGRKDGAGKLAVLELTSGDRRIGLLKGSLQALPSRFDRDFMSHLARNTFLEAHGGTIAVSGTEGQGSRFTVTLPTEK